MNILIIGSNGQLGNEMRLHAGQLSGHRLILTDVVASDYTDALLDATDLDSLRALCARESVDCIVNCAAYTAVDKAEEQEDVARCINALLPEQIGRVMTERHGRVVHVSTDYVFDGSACTPYREDDQTHPLGAYGRTKCEGEERLLSACPDSVIVRTAWLYSNFGNNFVKTMMRLGRERSQLRVVYDQVGSPTNAADLADALCRILNAEHFVPGIYHFTNEGVCSWYDFTKAIHEEAGITSCEVLPIRSEEYPTPTRRPNYSVLDKQKIKTTYGIRIAHWREALRRITFCLMAVLLLAGCKTEETFDWETLNRNWLEQNKAKHAGDPRFHVTSTGLQYYVEYEGNTKESHPNPNSSVVFTYTGKLIDGHVFDEKEGATGTVSGMVAGMTEALQQMYPSGDFVIFIPSDLGYGSEGSGTEGYSSYIPPHSTLIFKVHLSARYD